jgi:hypothetical protein
MDIEVAPVTRGAANYRVETQKAATRAPAKQPDSGDDHDSVLPAVDAAHQHIDRVQPPDSRRPQNRSEGVECSRSLEHRAGTRGTTDPRGRTIAEPGRTGKSRKTP